jgi:hypothetical protein
MAGTTLLITLASLSSGSGRVVAAAASNLRSSRRNDAELETHITHRSLEEGGKTFSCPPDHNGYYPTTDCKSYYWCSNGTPPSSILYSCTDGLLFDVGTGRCDWEQNVNCVSKDNAADGGSETVLSLEEQQWASTEVDFAAISSGTSSLRLTDAPTKAPVTQAPVTSQPTKAPVVYDPDNVVIEMGGVTVVGQYGEPMYFPDFPSHSCKGEKEGDEALKPVWMTANHMFRSKERCCQELFDWIDRDACLGEGFVELNLYGEAPKVVTSSSEPEEAPGKGEVQDAGTSESLVDVDTSESLETTDTQDTVASTPPPSKNTTDTQTTAQPTSQPTEATTTTRPTSSPTTNAPTPMPSRRTFIMSAVTVVAPPPPPPTPPPSRESSIMSLTSTSDQQQEATVASFSTINVRPAHTTESVAAPQPPPPSSSLVEIIQPTPRPTSPPTNYPTSLPTNIPTKTPTAKPTPTPPPTTSAPTISAVPTREGGIAVQAMADATVSQQDANKNYGSHPMLLVDGGMSGPMSKYDSLLKFDLSFLESGVNFEKIFLRIFVKDAGGSYCGRFETTQNPYWQEDSVTWMNAPTTSTGVNIGEAWNTISGEWFELEVTGALKWVMLHDKQKLLSVRISSTVARRCIFASSNDDEGHIPHLFARFSKEDAGSTAGSAVASTSTATAATTGSPPTPPPSPPPAGARRQHGEALLLFPTDDATITKEDSSGEGAGLTLAVKDDGSLTQDALIKFDIRDFWKTLPRSGTLMLHLPQSCLSAGAFVTTSRHGDSWSEDTVTWATAPMFQLGGNGLGTQIGVFDDQLVGGKYVGFDVNAALSWDTVTYQESVTFRISSVNGHGCEFTSSEGEYPPKLVVQF